MKLIRSILIAAFIAVPLFAQTPQVWVLDKNHSSAEFEIRHLMSDVKGFFRDLDATVTINEAQPERSSVEFTIKTASIDTRAADRDEHLRSPDFFEVAKYPTITFRSTAVVPKGKNQFDVTGDLTMHGVTKRITLPVVYRGTMHDPRGNERAGFKVETTLDRKDYNITWNRVLDEGGLLLGDEVNVEIVLQLAKKPTEATAAK